MYKPKSNFRDNRSGDRPNYRSNDRAPKTSWGNVASWYDEHLRTEGVMHKQVVIPGVFRMIDPKKGEAVLDVACGQGQLAIDYLHRGSVVTGVDAAPELIRIAKERVKAARFFVADARSMAVLKPGEFDVVSCVLALQNMDDIFTVMKEIARVMKKGARAIFVINHPAFRIPRQTSWGFDEAQKTQYRRIDGYLSDMKIPIKMHPGQAESATTWTFHRPMSAYIEAASRAGLFVDGMEEWVSPKVSTLGPKARAENRSRAEIPLFLAFRVKKF
jgi:ubiquinone/menaquinone biosynthesis C-methylase UbiE